MQITNGGCNQRKGGCDVLCLGQAMPLAKGSWNGCELREAEMQCRLLLHADRGDVQS